MPENKVLIIDIDNIIPPYLMLRVVDKRTLDYMELKDSLASHGILNSLLARKSSRFEGKYELIDGMYRLSCAKEIGLSQVPCVLVSASDEEALLMQIEANMQRPPTKRAEFAMHLKRLFASDPDLTFEALSVRINKNPGWIRDTLQLTRLCEPAKRELDAGNLTLSAAYAMCRLPQDTQEEFLPEAICMSGKDAAIICNNLLKNYLDRVCRNKAEKFYNKRQTPQAHLRNFRQVKSELEKPISGSVIIESIDDPEELIPLKMWQKALAWVLHLDSESVKKHETKQQAILDKMEQQIIERRKNRAVLKSQKELGLTDDWRISLIDD